MYPADLDYMHVTNLAEFHIVFQPFIFVVLLGLLSRLENATLMEAILDQFKTAPTHISVYTFHISCLA